MDKKRMYTKIKSFFTLKHFYSHSLFPNSYKEISFLDTNKNKIKWENQCKSNEKYKEKNKKIILLFSYNNANNALKKKIHVNEVFLMAGFHSKLFLCLVTFFAVLRAHLWISSTCFNITRNTATFLFSLRESVLRCITVLFSTEE